MAKKTLKFNVDEDHTGFEKVRVTPTKVFDTDENILDDIEGYSLLSNDDLKLKLEEDPLTPEQIKKIKAILKSRQ